MKVQRKHISLTSTFTEQAHSVDMTSPSVLCVDTKEERASKGCLALINSCCYIKEAYEVIRKEQLYWAKVKVEGDDTSSLPICAHISLKKPLCDCWPFFRRSKRLGTFTFGGNETHTSSTSFFDVQRLLECQGRNNKSSSVVKICVLTQTEKLVGHIALDLFLDEMRPGHITCYSLKCREGNTLVRLIVSHQERFSSLVTLGEEVEIEMNETRVDDATEKTNDRHTDNNNKESLDSVEANSFTSYSYRNSMKVESETSYSQDSKEVESNVEEGNTTEERVEHLSQYAQVISQEIYPLSQDVLTTWEEVQSIWKDVEPIWRHARAIRDAVHTGDDIDENLRSEWEEIRPVWEEITLIHNLVEKIREEARPVCEEVQPTCERVLQLWEELEQTTHEDGEQTPYTDENQPASGDTRLNETEEDVTSKIPHEHLSEYVKVISEEIYPLSQDVQSTWQDVRSVWKEMEPVWRQAEAIREAAHSGDVTDEQLMRDWEEIRPIWQEIALIRGLVDTIREEARPVSEEVQPTCERVLQLWEELQQTGHEDGEETPCTDGYPPAALRSSSYKDIYLIEGDFSPSQNVELFLVTPNGDPKRVRFCTSEEIDAADGRFIDYYENIHLVLQEVHEYSAEETG